MSLVVIDNDPWLGEYDLCERLDREIVDLLNKRSIEQRSSDTYARLSSSIRVRLKQFDTEVLQLGNKLRESTLSRNITLDEAERRERLIENLRTKSIQLQRRFNSRDTMSKTNRSELLGSTQNRLNFEENGGWSSASGDVDMLPEDPEPDMGQLVSMQKKMLKEQDAGLDQLAQTISRQKHIAIKIGTEVDAHHEIIEDISDRMERTATGLRAGTDQINVVARRDSTFCYWVIIIALFIAIIFVWV